MTLFSHVLGVATATTRPVACSVWYVMIRSRMRQSAVPMWMKLVYITTRHLHAFENIGNFLALCPIFNEKFLIGPHDQLTACPLFDATLLLTTDLNTDYLTNEIKQEIRIDEIQSFGFYIF